MNNLDALSMIFRAFQTADKANRRQSASQPARRKSAAERDRNESWFWESVADHQRKSEVAP
jgi:hypothetical protein